MSSYRSAGRLQGRVAIISGGDSGIGRAVAIGMAKEGADIVIAYRDEHEDAHETASLVQATGRRCLNLAGDVASVAFCKRVVDRAMKVCKRIDIVVNNAAEQHAAEDLTQIDAKTMGRTFATNIFGTFHLTQAALPHLGAGSSVIMTTSVVAYRGSPHLIDYAATKGALVAYTRSLALSLIDRGIRVNAVAPGPI